MTHRSWIQRCIAWLPILILPTAVVLLTPHAWPRWAYMWLLCGGLFAGCKWLTWFDANSPTASLGRQLGYLFGWPGLDAPTFLQSAATTRPVARSWGFALAKLLFGIALMWGVVPRMPRSPDLLRGWVGMIAIVFILHFGIFHLLCLCWRSIGVDARPLQNWPMRSTSVSEFWGKRWNTAFRDLTHRYLFRPLTAKVGGRAATLLGFLFSGLIHELVISIPAGAGYGGPTAFFLIQAAAVFFERSSMGQRLGLTSGVRGWAFTMLVLAGPVVLLFHAPFVRTVVVPFVDWLTHGATS